VRKIEKRKSTRVPPVYKRICIIPSKADPTTIKMKAIKKSVTPKKKVDLIILELKHVVTAVHTDRIQKRNTSDSVI
jgi:hypothetical protein|tara:strand:- start:490 stop:717 length:228 start_codon:yes stop_codon:yes gene_type:complete